MDVRSTPALPGDRSSHGNTELKKASCNIHEESDKPESNALSQQNIAVERLISHLDLQKLKVDGGSKEPSKKPKLVSRTKQSLGNNKGHQRI